MNRGCLVSLSGLDGSGKSTQVEILRERLEKEGYRCTTRLFEATHYGASADEIVESILAGGITCVFTRHSIDWSERYPLIRDFVYDPKLQTADLALAVTSVFAGAAVQVSACCIRPLLEHGVHVVCDRYWYDDLVYRGCWVDEALVRRLYAPMTVPDLAMMIDVSPLTTLHRNQRRADGKSPLLQSVEAVTDLRRRFHAVAQLERLVVVDGDRATSVVSDEITAHVLGVLRRDQ